MDIRSERIEPAPHPDRILSDTYWKAYHDCRIRENEICHYAALRAVVSEHGGSRKLRVEELGDFHLKNPTVAACVKAGLTEIELVLVLLKEVERLVELAVEAKRFSLPPVYIDGEKP